MKLPILSLLISSFAFLSSVSSAATIVDCVDALTFKSPIAVENDAVYLRAIVGVAELEIPKSEKLNTHLTDWTKSPDGYQLAALFTFTNKEGEPYASGSVVYVYEAYTGRLIRKVESKRTGRSIHWTPQNPNYVAVGFAENPQGAGLLFDNADLEDNVTIGLELFDSKTLERKKTVVLSRNWDDFKKKKNSLTEMEPQYSLIFDPHGGNMAKVYDDHFVVYKVERHYSLYKARKFKIQKTYPPLVELIFHMMRTPSEHFQYFVNKSLDQKR